MGSVEVRRVTREELLAEYEALRAEQPEATEELWALKADPDMCSCCYATVLSRDFGDDMWYWVDAVEAVLFLLGATTKAGIAIDPGPETPLTGSPPFATPLREPRSDLAGNPTSDPLLQ